MAAKKKSYYKQKTKKANVKVSPEILADLRKQIMQEFKDEEKRAAEKLEQERVAQRTAHQKFLEEMYASAEPWVEMQSWADTPQGVKVELEWNDAMINHLREQGITGVDDETVAQKWIALLLMQVNDSMENPEDRMTKFE